LLEHEQPTQPRELVAGIEHWRRAVSANDLSLNPDPHLAWIYDYRHPDYNTPRAEALREARGNAIRNTPQWMIDLALSNDEWKRRKP
jgi:hypothetical protein